MISRSLYLIEFLNINKELSVTDTEYQ